MADILKVTSPVIGKNIVQQNKNVTDPSIPFDLQEISHIARNPNSSALLPSITSSSGMRAPPH